MEKNSGTIAVIVVLIILSFLFVWATKKPEIVEKVQIVEKMIYRCPDNMDIICDNLRKEKIHNSDFYLEGWKDGFKAGQR